MVAPGLCTPVMAPLMAIEPLSPELDFAGITDLIFTSRHAVTAFQRLTDRRDLPCYVVGPATSVHAGNAGLDVALGVATVRALIPALPGAPHRFLYLRGVHISHDLAAEPSLAGRVREAVVYDQIACALPVEVRDAVVDGGLAGITLFSVRTAKRLGEELGGAEIPLKTRLFCISDAVAEAARPLGGTTVVAANPNAQGLIDAVQASFRR